ncbi:MAG: prepilin-type N-terminal cleavage/methylation domain-containing protein [Candidatus Omnitrophica bacterium]|nr:prepilin-type N-terminal cleavage/methylation domain-containing protein [Candidatus Omnitrophota bacterium]MCF7894122.1 prepilin-type N-terminal cleavage/methylation domain-containing protein [Candidatus Omnitrophota bacterium]
MVKNKKIRKSFSFVEIIIAIFIFSLVVAATGGVMFSIQNSWKEVKYKLDLVQQARWALEYMSADIREGKNVNASSMAGLGNVLKVEVDIGFDGNWDRVWYWEGDGSSSYGDLGVIYRGVDVFPLSGGVNSLIEATSVKQELVELVDTGADTEFSVTGGNLVTIILDLNKKGKKEIFRTQVWVRN